MRTAARLPARAAFFGSSPRLISSRTSNIVSRCDSVVVAIQGSGESSFDETFAAAAAARRVPTLNHEEEELQEGREEVHRQQRAGWFTTEEQLATAATAACVFLLAR